jgi:membrane protein implicated in regulation of membrane protease activity
MTTSERDRRAFRKYFLLELPGWILAASVLTGLVMWEALSQPVALGLFGLWVAKDFALYPLLRSAYEDSSRDGTHTLIGALGTAKDRLDPEGYVRVGSELWHARIDREAAPVEPGSEVRVREVKQLTLWVEAA